jgi:hypothetical protein
MEFDWAEQVRPVPFKPADPLWNPLRVCLFFSSLAHDIRGDRQPAGLVTGITRRSGDDGAECPGPCPFGGRLR